MIDYKDNLLDRRALDDIQLFLERQNWTYGWPSNKAMPFGHWNVDITKTGKNNPTDVSDRLPEVILPLWTQLNKAFFKSNAKLVRCYANRHTFGTEGYIHTDTEREQDMTCVVYMDKDWDVDWGGETVFYNQEKTEIIKAVIPKYGRISVFPGTIPHCAKPVSRICPKVRTTLMFKATIDPKAIYPAEELLHTFLIEIGANGKPHKRGSLADHLMRTFHLLKSVGAGDIVALAGGLHSVYGTNAFKKPCITKDDTRIKDKFGAEVDRIVRLFSEIDRPNCLETPDGSLTDTDLFILRCIECANLYDQDELTPENYPNLTQFVKQLLK